MYRWVQTGGRQRWSSARYIEVCTGRGRAEAMAMRAHCQAREHAAEPPVPCRCWTARRAELVHPHTGGWRPRLHPRLRTDLPATAPRSPFRHARWRGTPPPTHMERSRGTPARQPSHARTAARVAAVRPGRAPPLSPVSGNRRSTALCLTPAPRADRAARRARPPGGGALPQQGNVWEVTPAAPAASAPPPRARRFSRLARTVPPCWLN